MLKHLSVFCAVLFIVLSSVAGERVYKHGRFFLTGGRKVVIITPKDQPQYNDELAQFFSACGAQVMDGFFAQLIYPRVYVLRGAIEGRQGEGFSIRVNGSSIKIHYTSPQYIASAIAYLKGLYADPYAQRMILGVDVTFGEQVSGVAIPGLLKVDGGVVDCSTKFTPVATIQGAIKRQAAMGNRNMILLVGSPAAFRLRLECFNLFNPSVPITPKGESYTASAISEVFKFASQNNIKLTLGVDLLSDNVNFEKWSAHKLSSVEGMRLVRSMIEELAQKWGVRRLYIGVDTAPTASDSRYRAFLTKIATDNKMELIVL